MEKKRGMSGQSERPAVGASPTSPSNGRQNDFWFVCSGYIFRVGLALVTFEEVRPLGIMLSDYCFLLSLVLIPKSRLFKSRGSGVLLAGSLILVGSLLSLHDTSSLSEAAGSLMRLFLLFGLIAPLALSHSKQIRKNLFYLAGGVFLNCIVTLLQASVIPGIVDALSINPPQPDVGFTGRYQGLTEFPVTLGLSAALAVFIGIGLFTMEKSKVVRWFLAVLVFVCSIAALLSGSRTFLASLIPGLIVFALLQKKRRLGFVYAGAVVMVLWGAVTYVAPGVLSQYSQRLDTVGLVDYSRLASAAQAVVEISEKPILGWGVDHFDIGGVILIPETGEIAGAHNTFLRYWYAAGLLGAMGFLALFAIPSWQMLRMLNENALGRSGQVVPLILGLFVFFFIISNLGPYLYNRYLYVPLFILGGFSMHVLTPVRVQKPVSKTVLDSPGDNAIKATS
jgi:O-antigen ligase